MVDLIGVVLKRGNARDRKGLINAAGTRVMADPIPMTSSQLCSQNLFAKVDDAGGVISDAISPPQKTMSDSARIDSRCPCPTVGANCRGSYDTYAMRGTSR
jgi:hypothetical protein